MVFFATLAAVLVAGGTAITLAFTRTASPQKGKTPVFHSRRITECSDDVVQVRAQE
jgi:hypothetical protein